MDFFTVGTTAAFDGGGHICLSYLTLDEVSSSIWTMESVVEMAKETFARPSEPSQSAIQRNDPNRTKRSELSISASLVSETSKVSLSLSRSE